MALPPRVVLVHRLTELDKLRARHGTRGQVEFFLRQRGRDLGHVDGRHDAVTEAVAQVGASIPADWRRGAVERGDLDRFLFAAEDIVVVVGQDGLVANVAKYLDGQPVIGIDPDPGRNPGVLVSHPVSAAAGLLRSVVSGTASIVARAMVRGTLDDGQHLDALNEVYVGHPSHQSARYVVTDPGGRSERQSSSGVIVSTGTGATGWGASIARERGLADALPGPCEASLAWFAREAWPSSTTGTELTQGRLGRADQLQISVESEVLVVFGDGIEADRLQPSWGQRVSIAMSPRSLHLVTAAVE